MVFSSRVWRRYEWTTNGRFYTHIGHEKFASIAYYDVWKMDQMGNGGE